MIARRSASAPAWGDWHLMRPTSSTPSHSSMIRLTSNDGVKPAARSAASASSAVLPIRSIITSLPFAPAVGASGDVVDEPDEVPHVVLLPPPSELLSEHALSTSATIRIPCLLETRTEHLRGSGRIRVRPDRDDVVELVAVDRRELDARLEDRRLRRVDLEVRPRRVVRDDLRLQADRFVLEPAVGVDPREPVRRLRLHAR